jgi:hypothetical protein
MTKKEFTGIIDRAMDMINDGQETYSCLALQIAKHALCGVGDTAALTRDYVDTFRMELYQTFESTLSHTTGLNEFDLRAEYDFREVRLAALELYKLQTLDFGCYKDF